MPLTHKGETIEAAMEKQYGKEKGEEVFYASKNKGTITGVDDNDPIGGYMDACRRGDAVGIARHGSAMVRGRIAR